MGYKPYIVDIAEKDIMHENMATALENAIDDIKKIKLGFKDPVYPMIVLRTLKGWTGPKEYNGKTIEGSFRAHQVPIDVNENDPESLDVLEQWLRSYHPENIFNSDGSIKEEIRMVAPEEKRRMGDNPYANGGLLRKELHVPDFANYAIDVPYPGSAINQDMMELGKFVRDIISSNPNNFKVFGPDEALSNRLNHMFEATNRKWNLAIKKRNRFCFI